MNLHLGVIIHLQGALMMDEAAVIVTVTAIVTDTGAVNERVAGEEDRSTGHHRRHHPVVTKAGRGEGVCCWN